MGRFYYPVGTVSALTRVFPRPACYGHVRAGAGGNDKRTGFCYRAGDGFSALPLPPVQLSDLLRRLTKEERAEVLRRYGAAKLAASDLTALAGALSTPDALASAFLQLNNLQLLVLRWLARRPGFEAPWSALVEALKGRVPLPFLEQQLQDLRLWALADFAPRVPRGGPVPLFPGPDEAGFVATFAGAVSALPVTTHATLHGYLAGLDTEKLRALLVLQGVRGAPSLKPERLALLTGIAREPDSIQRRLQAVSPEARGLIDWFSGRGGIALRHEVEAHPVIKAARAGWGRRSYYEVDREGPLHELVSNCLVVPDTPYYASHYGIPEEVAEVLSGLTLFDQGPLQPPVLVQVDAAPVSAPDPLALCRDVGHLLGFVASGACEWKKDDGQPYQRSLQALGKKLGAAGSDYAGMLWNLAIFGDLVEPAAEGWRPLSLQNFSAQHLFARMWQSWAYGSPYSDGIRESMLRVGVSIPPDAWVLHSSVVDLLTFASPLRFSDQYRALWAASLESAWSEARYFAFATGTTTAGEPAVMVPEQVQRCLTWAPDQGGLETLAPWDPTWTVQSDRSVLVGPNCHPDALRELWEIAELESNQGAAVFRITPAALARALNRSLTPEVITKRLVQWSGREVPATVARLLQDQRGHFGRLKAGWATAYVVADDDALLEEVLRNPKLRRLGLRRVAPGVAAVSGEGSEGTLQALRRAGYLPVEDKGGADPPQLAGPPAFVARGPARRRRRGGRL